MPISTIRRGRNGRTALAGFSANRGPNRTAFNDLQCGDSGAVCAWLIAMDGWRTRPPFHGSFHEEPRFTQQEFMEYSQRMPVASVPVTINLIITQDVTRKQPVF